MRNAIAERDKLKDIAQSYRENKVAIHDALIKEFSEDLPAWNAEINPNNLSLNFKSPDVLFDTGEITLKERFTEILADFFPRYLKVLDKFKDSIEEIRIEGHTSSKWGAAPYEVAYFNNMSLSQGRTRSVLSYIYSLDSIKNQRPWVKSNIAAVGYSSSKLIIKNGIEDSELSRRVAFRIITNSEDQILKILGR